MDFDMFIYTSNGNMDPNYIHFDQQEITKIFENPRCRVFTTDNSLLDGIEDYRERERNIFYQWYKLWKCSQLVPTGNYDWIVRIRPDIKFLQSAKSFAELLPTLSPTCISIPIGNDRSEKEGINDQLAIGSPSSMKTYCSFYTYLVNNASKPLISEVLLHRYLHEEKISIQRINLPYSLYLSDCVILAITGDSGVGKSTVLSAIQKIFPFDSSLTLETDRYHKWERSDERWNSMTHLHPEANHLEKLVDDTFHLKLGNTICAVDYDHSSGKFTAPQSLEPKPILLLCGLHSLYKETLRNQIDIRIYVDTEEQLKTYWKVSRDLQKRNRTLEDILHSIQKRQGDFREFIEPQKNHANLIFHYWYDGSLPDYLNPLDPTKLRFRVECSFSLLSYVSHVLYTFSSSARKISQDRMSFAIRSELQKKDFLEFLTHEQISIKSPEDIEESYLGLCQLLVLCLLT